MTTAIQPGLTTWNMAEDDEGHREYHIEFKVRADDTDGPYNVRNTAGLPLPGSFWQFRGDIDPVAFCKRRSLINPIQKDSEATTLWKAGFTFSTRPDKRCQDNRFEDPLTEPMRVSGSWTRYKEEATKNRFGNPLKFSSHERMKGPQIEFETGLPTVRVEQNVLNLELDLLAALIHTVNDAPLWGLPIRCVRLASVSWSKEFYGSCYPYYKRSLEFEVNPDTFDRDIADEGRKVLYGRWERPGVWRILCIDGDWPDHKNPAHFVDFKSYEGNPSVALLNGKGLPAGVCIVWDECAGQGLHGKRLGCPDETGTGAININTLTTTGNLTDYYVSIWDGNRGNSVLDEDTWVNIRSSVVPRPWVPLLTYDRGSLVTSGGYVWVALRGSRGEQPRSNRYAWQFLGNASGTGASTVPNDRGVFDWCTTYNLGDYIRESSTTGLLTGTGPDENWAGCDRTKPAFIRVEHYHEGAFALLGIPATL